MSVGLTIEVNSEAIANDFGKIVENAFEKKGKFSRTQLSYISNRMTEAFREYIGHVASMDEWKHLEASYHLESTSSVLYRGVTSNNKLFGYNFGLEMEEYGYVLGEDDMRIPMSMTVETKLVYWLKHKLRTSTISLNVGKWKKSKDSGRYEKTGEKAITGKPSDYRKIAWAIMKEYDMGGAWTLKDWYIKALRVDDSWETGNPRLKELVEERLITTGNLIPAITKAMAEEIEKNGEI